VDIVADGVVGRIEDAGLPPIDDILRSHDIGRPFFVSVDVPSSPPLDCNSWRPKGELCLDVVEFVLVVESCSDSWGVLRRKRETGSPERLCGLFGFTFSGCETTRRGSDVPEEWAFLLVPGLVGGTYSSKPNARPAGATASVPKAHS
jgi:hypothetical protein